MWLHHLLHQQDLHVDKIYPFILMIFQRKVYNKTVFQIVDSQSNK